MISGSEIILFPLVFMIVATLVFLHGISTAAYGGDVNVIILDPKDGSSIFLNSGESMPARRPIRGHITSITKEELEDEQLLVDVSIKTDKWYRQGVSRVKTDGSWVIRTAHFGGADHLVRADLKDRNGNIIATAESTVLIVQ